MSYVLVGTAHAQARAVINQKSNENSILLCHEMAVSVRSNQPLPLAGPIGVFRVPSGKRKR